MRGDLLRARAFLQRFDGKTTLASILRAHEKEGGDLGEARIAVEELVKKEQDLREELFRLRFQHVTGQLENPIRLRILRRELARVITVRKEQTGDSKQDSSTVKKAG